MAYAYGKKRKSGTVFYAAYKGPDGKVRSEGTFKNKRDAEKHADKREREVSQGQWVDPGFSKLTFTEYVDNYYRPATAHLELTTRVAYDSYLRAHFTPRFGAMPMRSILPSMVQAWVIEAGANLSARSVIKYHKFLSSVFERAVAVDRVIPANPCARTSLPTFVRRRLVVITPEQFDALFTHIPTRYATLTMTEIETGLRWGELIALRPTDIDFQARRITVQRTIVEVSSKASPTGERFVVKPYPKDREIRTLGISKELSSAIKSHMLAHGIRDNDLLFTTTRGHPISRATFRKRVLLPAIESAGLAGQGVTFHRLRAAHASWLLAGGADLQVVMRRLGHRHLATTEQYLDILDDADERALTAFASIRNRSQAETT